MAAPKRSKALREQHLALTTKWYFQGILQAEIAQRVGVSQQQVSYDLKELQKRWQASALVDINEHKAKELGRIDRLEVTYWEAWERSLKDAETTTQKAVEAGDQTRKEATKVAKGQAGDPRFLAGVQWCITKRCDVLGLEAPKRQQLTGKLEIEFVNDWRQNTPPDAT